MKQTYLLHVPSTQAQSAEEWFAAPVVISIYCSITVNHRLTGPGKMVKVRLLFVGNYNQNNAVDIPITTNYCYY